MYIINKQKIKVTEEKITKKDRTPYVRDNNYGDIKGHDLQKIDEAVMSKIEYSEANEKISEDYKELDEYLETRFIPTYVLLKQRKNKKGKIEYFPSIRLHHITALKLSEAEFEHVMNFLKEKNIRVGGKGATLDSEFDNYDYVSTYKESVLPLSVPANVTLGKIKLYKQNKDQKLRDEIITDNMRLVPYVAYRYAISSGINQHELESYGYEGLILALENYDANYGCSFSTFTIAYIRGKILDGIQVIMQGNKNRFYYNYVNAKLAVEKENGVTLSENPELIDDVIDLLVATGKIGKNTKSREQARMKITSLSLGNMSLSDEDVLEELITSRELLDTHDYAEEALNSVLRDDLKKILYVLNDKELEVLRLRCGYYDGEAKTQEEVGKILNLSRERIRQIEHRALWKLRNSNRAKYIEDYYDDTETEKFSR